MSLTTPHQAPPAGLGISTGFPMAPTWVFWRTITSSSLYFGVHLNWVESSPPFNYTQGTGALRRDLIKETVRPWWGTADREECWAHQSWVLVSALLLTWLCGLEPLASLGLSFFICKRMLTRVSFSPGFKHGRKSRVQGPGQSWRRARVHCPPSAPARHLGRGAGQHAFLKCGASRQPVSSLIKE